MSIYVFSEAPLLCHTSSTSDCKRRQLFRLHRRDQRGTGALTSPRTREVEDSLGVSPSGANTSPWLVPARREHGPGRWLEERLLWLPGVARGPGFQRPSLCHSGKLESHGMEPGSAWERRLRTCRLKQGSLPPKGQRRLDGGMGLPRNLGLPQGLARGSGAGVPQTACARPEVNPTQVVCT